jgi:hypothetical protein
MRHLGPARRKVNRRFKSGWIIAFHSSRNFVAVNLECAYIADTGLRQTPR